MAIHPVQHPSDQVKGLYTRDDPVVPPITDERLAELMGRFTPLVEGESGLFRIEPVDPRRTAFTWDPTTVGEPVDFRPVQEVWTDHLCGFYGFFKPSIAEVLAQVPEGLPEECNAYWIDTSYIENYRSGDGHRAKTIFGVVS